MCKWMPFITKRALSACPLLPCICMYIWETEGIERGVRGDGRGHIDGGTKGAWIAINGVSRVDRLYSRGRTEEEEMRGGEESRRATQQTVAVAAAAAGDWYQRSGTATWSSQPASLQQNWTHWTHWARWLPHCTAPNEPHSSLTYTV